MFQVISRTTSSFFLSIILLLPPPWAWDAITCVRFESQSEQNRSGLKRALGFVSPRLHYHQVDEAGKALSTRTDFQLSAFLPPLPLLLLLCVCVCENQPCMANLSSQLGLVGLISIWFRTKSLNLGHPKNGTQAQAHVKLMSKQIATGNI